MALDQNIKNQLSTYMAKIENPIEIVYFENEKVTRIDKDVLTRPEL